MPIPPSAIQQLQAAADAGDYRQYYNLLIQNGVEYGHLGLAAATNGDSTSVLVNFAGNLANRYLDQKYRDETGATLSNALREQVRVDLIRADFNLRAQGEVSAAQIRDYHYSVFQNVGVPPAAWTGTFFDSRTTPAAWCWTCGAEEIGSDLPRFLGPVVT